MCWPTYLYIEDSIHPETLNARPADRTPLFDAELLDVGVESAHSVSVFSSSDTRFERY